MQDALVVGGEQLYVYSDYRSVMRPWMQIGCTQCLADSYESMYNAPISFVREALE